MGEQIKSFNLFNLDDIISVQVKELLLFTIRYQITNTKDIENLLIYYILKEVLQLYKTNSGLLLFYLSTKCYNWLESDESIIRHMNFKKLLNIFTKKIHFPIVITSISFNDFKNLLKSNSPEYDELLNEYQFIGSYFDEIVKLIKSLKFVSLEEKLLNNILEQMQIIMTF